MGAADAMQFAHDAGDIRLAGMNRMRDDVIRCVAFGYPCVSVEVKDLAQMFSYVADLQVKLAEANAR